MISIARTIKTAGCLAILSVILMSGYAGQPQPAKPAPATKSPPPSQPAKPAPPISKSAPAALAAPQLSAAEKQAGLREALVFNIESHICDLIRTNHDWEEAEFRNYKQDNLDGDEIDDAILLTTFEHGNTWRREMFVCLSSAPEKVMSTGLGGKGEREADEVVVTNQTIIIKGRKYAETDALCCPSIPYESTYVIMDGKIAEKK